MPADLPTVLEITETDLRPVFLHEATGFTRWLFQPDNLAWLGRALDMVLVPVSTETSTGTFRLDILARDAATDDLVVIENQFARSDHDHLGKTLSYLAATNAKSVVWLAEAFADEHRAALEWLNDHTPEGIGFWAVVPKMLRIGDGPPGLRFDVIVRPNRAVKAARAGERSMDPGIGPLRERYWTIFRDMMNADPEMAAVTARHGGRAGHLTLYPDRRFETIRPRVNVLAYLNLGGAAQSARLHTRPNPDESPVEWQTRIADLRAGLSGDIEAVIQGDWNSDEGLRDIARQHQAAAKRMLRATAAMFEPEAALAPE